MQLCSVNIDEIFKHCKMKNFNVPTREEVSANNQAIFDDLNKGLGFVPNLYAAMAHSENGLGRYLAFQGAKTSLNNKEKEAVNLVVSQVNECRYCQSAHSVLGKMNGFEEDEILLLRNGNSSNEKINSLVVLTKALTEQKGKVNDTLVQNFFDQGYTKEHLIDLIIQIGDKIVMNYLHNLTQIEIDFPIAPEL